MTFNVGDIVAEGTEDETLEPTYFLIVDEWETTFHMLTLNTNSLFICQSYQYRSYPLY